MPVEPLAPTALYTACDPASLPFATTAELGDFNDAVGQDRAVAALRFGLGIRSEGFNLYCLGPKGTGKASLIQQLLSDMAASQAPPDDWCYLFNFSDPHRPRALRLPAGRAAPLRRDMDALVQDLRVTLPAAFESDDFRGRKTAIEDELKARHEKVFEDLQKKAADHGVSLMRTPVGIALAPLKDGEVLAPEDFKNLPDAEQGEMKRNMEILQAQMEDIVRQMPKWEQEQRDKMKALVREITRFAVGHLIDDLSARYHDLPAVKAHLEAVRQDVIDNAGDFLPGKDGAETTILGNANHQGPGGHGTPSLRRYQVNVLVNNGEATGAPVVFEDHPTQPNLLGRIEHIQQFGALLSDFTLIKAGALHRANGGYLVIQARKLLTQPFAWEDLKRALRSRQLRIEMPGAGWGLSATITLDPEPIPLSVKVVLVGEPMIYYLLSRHDPDFTELFKVAADFDYHTDRTPKTTLEYARLIATLTRREDLRVLSREAVARVIEHAARLSGDAGKLSTHMASVADLVRAADYWAGADGAGQVERGHVQQAIDAQIHREDRINAHMREEILRDTLLIDTSGAVTGQINGLSVFQFGPLAFGKPSRITCRVRVGKGEVIDIEREVDLGGPLHTKGVLIMASFLASRFSTDTPLSLSATLVFEQSYGEIDGDSASSAELYALLSALAEAPIRQSFAVTGSVDQFGKVQAIGGVNEKIEGFFEVCRERGFDAADGLPHGVLIPAANCRHLMLRHDVVAAVEAGRFAIYPVTTIDDGIELLTGIPAGVPDARGEYPVGTLNRRVTARVREMAAKAHRSENGRGPGSGRSG